MSESAREFDEEFIRSYLASCLEDITMSFIDKRMEKGMTEGNYYLTA